MNLAILSKLNNKGVVTAASKGLFLVRKYSPEILTTVGVVGTVTAAVFASKATLKLEPVIDNHKNRVDFAKDKTHVMTAEEYSSTAHKRELAMVYFGTAGDIVKLYGPAVTLGMASIACIIGAHGVMNKRNVAVVAAYKGLEQTFSEYRKRVVEELGEEKDAQFLFNSTREVEIDEDGNSRMVEINPHGVSANVKFFDETNKNWSEDPNYNLMFLRAQEAQLTNELKANGHIFLNEVYDRIGLEHTKAGSILGWWWKGDGDNFVDFGMKDFQKHNAAVYGTDDEDCIMLDFNYDGPIFDRLPEN